MEIRCKQPLSLLTSRRNFGAWFLLFIPMGSSLLPVLAAVLAVLGYSVNESVIIFDRCRECFRKIRKGTPVEIVNTAITQTISRTIITHSSTLMVTLAMFFFGGPAFSITSL